MSHPAPQSWLRSLDPRQSLATAAIWLIAALAMAFSIAAGIWVGRIARDNVSEQHIRRLALETDQLSSDLGQAVAGRLDAIRAAERILDAVGDSDDNLRLQAVFSELTTAYPEFDWIAVARPDGTLIGGRSGATEAANTGESAAGAVRGAGAVANARAAEWFTAGMRDPWIGVATEPRAGVATEPHAGVATEPHAGGATEPHTGAATEHAALGDLAAPVRDRSGRAIGVILAHLSWRRGPSHPERLTDEPEAHAEAYVLDGNGVVLVGPAAIRDRPWNGMPLRGAARDAALAAPEFEALPDGRRVLISRAPVSAGPQTPGPGWQVQLAEPEERVFRRAHEITLQILWVSLSLGAATVLLGLICARQLTARLRRLTESVVSAGQSEGQLEVPAGVDEVARLGEAFASILGDLQRERRELQTLSRELERRVAVRTREVERLAEESRYAAIVRERLKIARDLHDTLAHSMMALLSEIRYLRRLQARDPLAVAEELKRAEELAHEGLNEARSAISQMRVTAVRDTGLGPAIAKEFERFVDRSGLTGAFESDPEPARFGDERAETLLRMTQEALRNIERHAGASRADVRLKSDGDRLELTIEDDGTGFDPAASRAGHYGLTGLREQAELIGAELYIESAPQRGTRIAIALRMAPAAFRAATSMEAR